MYVYGQRFYGPAQELIYKSAILFPPVAGRNNNNLTWYNNILHNVQCILLGSYIIYIILCRTLSVFRGKFDRFNRFFFYPDNHKYYLF